MDEDHVPEPAHVGAQSKPPGPPALPGAGLRDFRPKDRVKALMSIKENFPPHRPRPFAGVHGRSRAKHSQEQAFPSFAAGRARFAREAEWRALLGGSAVQAQLSEGMGGCPCGRRMDAGIRVPRK